LQRLQRRLQRLDKEAYLENVGARNYEQQEVRSGELRALYESRGITPDYEVIPYCQTGYRSAHAFLAMRLLGYPRVRNYVGSWNEWARRPELPVAVPEA